MELLWGQETHPEVFPQSSRARRAHGARAFNEYPSQWAAIESIAPKIGCVAQTLHDWVKKHVIDTGLRDSITSEERDRIKALEREVKELHRGNETLKLANVFLVTA